MLDDDTYKQELRLRRMWTTVFWALCCTLPALWALQATDLNGWFWMAWTCWCAMGSWAFWESRKWAVEAAVTRSSARQAAVMHALLLREDAAGGARAARAAWDAVESKYRAWDRSTRYVWQWWRK